ncbi:MAG: YIP1 family protein [Alphaproteobacteria bacterium]|nr:YIP1 family protein [Alphaproteobacteria bacterium]
MVTLLRTPAAGWAEIARDPPPPRAVALQVLAPLAALAAACPALGRAVFGETALGVTYRPSLVETMLGFVVSAVLILGGAALTAMVVDRCAPAFEGKRSFPRAFALVAFAITPALLAAALTFVPALWPLALAGLYAIPLLVFGLPPMMQCPPDRATAYATVVVVAALVIVLVAAALSACVGQLL